MVERYPLSPAEFDTACRALEHLHPELWATSGARSPVHNIAVGGDPDSKHALRPAMARDYGAPTVQALESATKTARELGLWFLIHAVDRRGRGIHLHVQGLPTGPVATWWLDKYEERNP